MRMLFGCKAFRRRRRYRDRYEDRCTGCGRWFDNHINLAALGIVRADSWLFRCNACLGYDGGEQDLGKNDLPSHA